MNRNQSEMKKSVYKKWWFWVIIVVVVIGVVANLGSNGENNSSVTTATSASSTEATPEKDTPYGLNNTAVFKSIKITANELKESSGTDFFTPENGNTFVGVQFMIENTSNEDQTISSLMLFDAYVDGVKCDYSLSANCVFSDGTLDGTISPGKKMVGYYAVEAPTSWGEIELQVKSSWLSNSKADFVFKKNSDNK